MLLEQYHQDAQAMATLPLDVAAPPAANDNEARRQLQRSIRTIDYVQLVS